MPDSAQYKKNAEEIFKYAVAAAQPNQLIDRNIKIIGRQLQIAGQEILLDKIHNIYVIGAGKATAPMASALEKILGNHIKEGLIIVKHGHGLPLQHIHTIEAGHPVPDENGIVGTQQILQLMHRLTSNDLVIALFSGGGSSLLIDVPPGCNLMELQQFFELLLKSGASIVEMNTVRKHLSQIKGGQLARAVNPARLITLILSDVVGDRLDVIASGPTVADPTTFAEAWQVIQDYKLENHIPSSILNYLQVGIAGIIPDTPKPGDSLFDAVSNYVIGSNSIALEAAKQKAEQLGFYATILASNITGEAREIALQLVGKAREIALDKNHLKPACLLMGGETTVIVREKGLGGRNQELALAAALALNPADSITILSAGTDGSDGPTDAAGAVVDGNTVVNSKTIGLDAQTFLDKNDSYHFFRQARGHIITGPTMTNVMDIMLALVE